MASSSVSSFPTFSAGGGLSRLQQRLVVAAAPPSSSSLHAVAVGSLNNSFQQQLPLNNHSMINRLPDEDEDPYILKGIKYPGKHDVMLGRGGESTYHCGNIAFRQLVEQHKTKYYTAPRANKSRVVAEVVRKWRNMNPPGRFLTRSSSPSLNNGGSSNNGNGTHEGSTWEDVGDRRALKKASHSLRDSVRCFSIEKKQQMKAKEEEQEHLSSEDDTVHRRVVVSDESASSDSDNNNNNPTPSSLVIEPEISVHQFHPRKRGRINIIMDPALMTSGNTQKNKMKQQSHQHYSTTGGIGGAAAAAGVLLLDQERPTKMRRVACDEREEAQEDCRRDGREEDDTRGGRDDDYCPRGGDERDGGDYYYGSIPKTICCGQQPSTTPSSTSSSSSYEQSFLTSNFSWNAVQEKSSNHMGVLNARVAHRLQANASPCGSIDWFGQGTEDLPVQGPSHALPPAAILVNEEQEQQQQQVQQQQHAPAASLDDDSLGWFTDDEDNGLDVASFSAKPPPFGMFAFRPILTTATRGGHVSAGREE